MPHYGATACIDVKLVHFNQKLVKLIVNQAVGTYNPSTGQGSCSPCPSGTYIIKLAKQHA